MDLRSLLKANADRAIAVGLVIVGAFAVVLGWVGVSGTGLAAEQIPYLVSGGIGGLLFIVVGCTAWLSADLQDEWRRLDAIEEHLDQLARSTVESAPSVDPVMSENGFAQTLSSPAPPVSKS
jgi:hypothetical protein